MSPGGAANQLGSHLIAHRYDPDWIDATLGLIDEVMGGGRGPGWVGGDNATSVAFGNGYVYVSKPYDDGQQLVVTAETFRAAFVWLRELVGHPDFTNPAPVAPLGALVVDVVANGPGSDRVYEDLRGSFAATSHPSTDHLT